MSALTPGLYRATVRGVADTIVLVHKDGTPITATPVDGCSYHAGQITDARPLIVLDLSAIRSDAVLVQHLRESGTFDLADLAAQIEAQTKPARIPEPGLWGVVEAAIRGGGQIRFTFIKATSDLPNRWVDVDDGAGCDWDDLIDPTLIREGLS